MSLRTILLQTKKEAEEQAKKRKAEENSGREPSVKRRKRFPVANPEDAEYNRLVESYKKSTELLFTETGQLQPSSKDPRASGLFKTTLQQSDFETLHDWYENVIKPSIPCMIEWGEGKRSSATGYACLSESGNSEADIRRNTNEPSGYVWKECGKIEQEDI